MYMLYNPRAVLSIFLASSYEKRKNLGTTYYKSADIESQVIDPGTFQFLQCVKEELSNIQSIFYTTQNVHSIYPHLFSYALHFHCDD